MTPEQRVPSTSPLTRWLICVCLLQATLGTLTAGSTPDEHRIYENVDEEPVARVRIPPKLPDSWHNRTMKASATIEIVVAADGSVSEAVIKRSSNPEYAEAARSAVLKWRFRPGKKKGKAVAVRFRQDMEYIPGQRGTSARTDDGPKSSEKLTTLPQADDVKALAGSPAADRAFEHALGTFFDDKAVTFGRVKGDGDRMVCPSLTAKYQGMEYATLLADLQNKHAQLGRKARVELLPMEDAGRIAVFPHVVLKKGDLAIEAKRRLFFHCTNGKLTSVEWGDDFSQKVVLP